MEEDFGACTRFSFEDQHDEAEHIAASVKNHQESRFSPSRQEFSGIDLNLLASQLELLLSSPQLLETLTLNEGLRSRLHTTCHTLVRRLESPLDTIHRFSYHALPFSLARIGTTTGLWRVLDEKYPEAVSLEALSWHLGMEGKFLERLLRFGVVEGMVERVASPFGKEAGGEGGKFRATNVGRTLAGGHWERGVQVIQSCMVEATQNLPDWLAKHQYEEPIDPEGTPLALWKNLEKSHPWERLEDKPAILANYNKFMSTESDYQPQFAKHFPLAKYVDEERLDFGLQRMQFIDVGGGGNGETCRGVLRRWPFLRDRIVLQHSQTPAVVDEEGVEVDLGYKSLPHCFFLPQPIRGAKVYYLREVLHDWPDEQCVEILGHLRAALAQDSVILLDDLIVDWNTLHWAEVANDLLLMCALGARQRTLAEWDVLLEESGLQRWDTYYYGQHGRAIQVLVAANLESDGSTARSAHSTGSIVSARARHVYSPSIYSIAPFPDDW